MEWIVQDTIYKRTDYYDGSIGNRSRFAVEVTEAIVNAIEVDRVGMPLNLFSTY